MSDKLEGLPPIKVRRLENGYLLIVGGTPERLLVAVDAEQVGRIVGEWGRETERHCPLWQPGQAATASPVAPAPPAAPKPGGAAPAAAPAAAKPPAQVEGDAFRYATDRPAAGQ